MTCPRSPGESVAAPRPEPRPPYSSPGPVCCSRARPRSRARDCKVTQRGLSQHLTVVIKTTGPWPTADYYSPRVGHHSKCVAALTGSSEGPEKKEQFEPPLDS